MRIVIWGEIIQLQVKYHIVVFSLHFTHARTIKSIGCWTCASVRLFFFFSLLILNRKSPSQYMFCVEAAATVAAHTTGTVVWQLPAPFHIDYMQRKWIKTRTQCAAYTHTTHSHAHAQCTRRHRHDTDQNQRTVRSETTKKKTKIKMEKCSTIRKISDKSRTPRDRIKRPLARSSRTHAIEKVIQSWMKRRIHRNTQTHDIGTATHTHTHFGTASEPIENKEKRKESTNSNVTVFACSALCSVHSSCIIYILIFVLFVLFRATTYVFSCRYNFLKKKKMRMKCKTRSRARFESRHRGECDYLRVCLRWA